MLLGTLGAVEIVSRLAKVKVPLGEEATEAEAVNGVIKVRFNHDWPIALQPTSAGCIATTPQRLIVTGEAFANVSNSNRKCTIGGVTTSTPRKNLRKK